MQTIVDVMEIVMHFMIANLNFYAAGGQCNATSIINDVVYHEYGHSVLIMIYTPYGGIFNNGALW